MKRNRLLLLFEHAFNLQGSNTFSLVASLAMMIFALGWFINNTAPLLGLCGRYLFHMGGFTPSPEWADSMKWRELGITAVADAFLPSILLGITMSLIYRNLRNAPSLTNSYDLVVPPPYKGLIVMLSPLRFTESHPYVEKTLSAALALEKHLQETGMRDELMKTNWGPLVAAVEHHAVALENCWIVFTKGQEGSKADFPSAVKVIQCFAPNVKCYEVELEDSWDISHIIPKINAIYDDARSKGIFPEDIIADFTGGTAAMSGGMILATLEDKRDLEYLLQKEGFPPLAPKNVPLSREKIRDNKMLVTIKTTPAMVPVNQKPH